MANWRLLGGGSGGDGGCVWSCCNSVIMQFELRYVDKCVCERERKQNEKEEYE